MEPFSSKSDLKKRAVSMLTWKCKKKYYNHNSADPEISTICVGRYSDANFGVLEFRMLQV